MKKKQIKSFYPKKNSVPEKWVLYNASGKILGKAASDIASLLLGKYSATYTPGVFTNHYVVVVNADKIKVTGKKMTDKKYYRHSGYPGGLKEATLGMLMEKKPTEALKKAVKGMLPNNSYGRLLETKAMFYEGESHKHDAQQPVEFTKG